MAHITGTRQALETSWRQELWRGMVRDTLIQQGIAKDIDQEIQIVSKTTEAKMCQERLRVAEEHALDWQNKARNRGRWILPLTIVALGATVLNFAQ